MLRAIGASPSKFQSQGAGQEHYASSEFGFTYPDTYPISADWAKKSGSSTDIEAMAPETQ
jgi:hypothetical protein